MFSQFNSRRRFASSTRRNIRDRRRSFESLESRQVMAGNITAVVDGAGNLTITGDDLDNGLYITQSGQSEFQILGLEAGGAATTINGSTESITLKNVTGSITIKTGAGNDLTQFEYFSHVGDLSIDTQLGQDIINIGTSNRRSNLTGDIAVSFSWASTLNLLNTNIVGAAKFEYVGLAEAEVLPVQTTPLPGNVPPRNPLDNFQVLTIPCSFAITGCEFSEDVLIRANLQQVQVFVESTDIGGKLTINNAAFDASNAYRNTFNRSFVVLNNVSADGGLAATLHSSTSFVINRSNFDPPIDPLAELPVAAASSVRINLYGKQNILQITDTFIRENLTLDNKLYTTFAAGMQPLAVALQSEYDIVQINGLEVQGTTSLTSHGNVSVKNSELAGLLVSAKYWIKIVDTTATNVSTSITTAWRSARTMIEGCEFTDLAVYSNLRNRRSQSVAITDSKITGTVSIGGRSGFVPDADGPFTYEQISSKSNASLKILSSEIGTLKYSFEEANPTDPRALPNLLIGGAGIDRIEIRDSKFGDISAKLGAGDDIFYFHNTSVTGTAYADGGLGFDVKLDEQLLGATTAFFEQFEDTAADGIFLN